MVFPDVRLLARRSAEVAFLATAHQLESGSNASRQRGNAFRSVVAEFGSMSEPDSVLLAARGLRRLARRQTR